MSGDLQNGRGKPAEDVSLPDLFLAVLALVAFGLSVLQLTDALTVNEEMPRLLELIDLGICVFFFADFVRSLIKAPDRWHYLKTWGWFDLLSSIPVLAIPHAVFGQTPVALRLVRLVRVLRAIRSIRILLRVTREDRTLAFISSLLLVGIVVFIGSCIGVLWAETRPGISDELRSSVTLDTAEDILWWAVVTSSTVGYGDTAPVTVTGKVFAFGLMLVGIGAFATLTSTLGVLISRLKRRGREPIDAVLDRLERIEATLDRLERRLGD